MYAYYLEDEDLEYIELVIANGEPFILEGNAGQTERKRDKKAEEKKKEQQEQKGIDVTSIAEAHKDKKGRWITLYDYNSCKFISNNQSGRTYECSHCNK